MNQQAPLNRFGVRAVYYAQHRPGYPTALYGYLQDHAILIAGAPVADLGSGTGLLSQLFLEHGHSVYGIEPNAPMRAAGEEYLDGYDGFHSLDGRAEAIPLEDHSVALLTAGQAFHWFDPVAFKAEAARVLRPGSHVALIWNRRVEGDPLIDEYEALLDQHAIDYDKADPKHRMNDDKIAAFFAPQVVQHAIFPNSVEYDWDGLFGLAMSQSYVPLPEHPNHPAFLSALTDLFARYQQDGCITWRMHTRLYHALID